MRITEEQARDIIDKYPDDSDRVRLARDLLDEREEMRTRPSFMCTSPGCKRGVMREGECWTCPACAEKERAAHAATREELRRAREALQRWLGGYSAEEIEKRRLAPDNGSPLAGTIHALAGVPAPTSPSTEAAVRAGIEAAKAAIIAEAGDASEEAVETFGARLFVLAIEDLDPAAIAARLEGR